MTHLDLRNKFFTFWQQAPRNHTLIPGSSLVPDNDATTLFISAGMHPLVPYLLGQTHPGGKRLVDVQKALRTDDIDEVGDAIHHTFFEMLGNWSLGDYFKEDAIKWSYEFLIDVLKLEPERLYVTCFAGDQDAPKDDFSANIWRSLKIPEERIFFYGKKDNWWGPVGNSGPCGPDTEMHYDLTQKPCGENCKPGCSCGRFSEIWNNVFMEYMKTKDGKFEKLAQQNVDTGMGLERTLAILNGLNDDYLTELWTPAIKKIEELTGKKYEDNLKSFRIIADHTRAAVFVISDGIIPSNKERGYILRRLIRRSMVEWRKLGVEKLTENFCLLAEVFIEIMKDLYPDLEANKEKILAVITDETKRFNNTLEKGLREFNKLESIDGEIAFNLFQTFGFPWEITVEMAQEKGIVVSKEEFQKSFLRHQELSRTASAGMFKGGLADSSEIVTKYHSATHLLQATLRKILGDHVHQEGSNLTAERLRFDFSHDKKLTPEEINQIEDIMNKNISDDLIQDKKTMPYDEAIKLGAMAFFKEKYPPMVTVYTFTNKDGVVISREICGGPHVEHTNTMGRFKIIKEEAVAAGIRRIYATLT